MEKHPNPFDDFVREAMKGHGLTPSGKARKAFLDEAPAALPPGKSWKKWYIIPVILIFLGGLVAVFVLTNENSPEEKATIHQPTANIQVPSADIQQPTADIQEPITNSQQPTANSQEPSAISNEPTAAIQKTTATIQQPTANIQEPPASSQQPTANLQEPTAISKEPTANIQETTATIQQPTATIQAPSANSQEPPATIQQPTANIQEPPASSQQPTADIQEPTAISNEPEASNDQPVPWRVAASVYYNPELMFNTLEGNKPVNNFGMEAIFYHGLVSIRTGVGLSVSKGITENSVNYNDYLGAYNKLDSMAFTFNEELNNFEPEFYMSNEKVWDSVPQSDSTEIIKRYTYLQVPLVLGFDFWQKGKISVGVRVGTIMSVLLKSQQLTGEYDPGESLVIGVNQLTPSQVSTNWQATGGFDVSAVLTKRIGLEIEPQARYYYGSIYEKSGDIKKPWSLGIRAAIVYKF
jgi:cytoskeletal protein RodZ